MSDLGRAQRSILHTENLWAILQKSANDLQTVPAASYGLVEGVGGLKTSEAYHSKPDTLVIPEM